MNLLKNTRYTHNNKTFEILSIWLVGHDVLFYQICELITHRKLTYRDNYRTIYKTEMDKLTIKIIK